MDSLKTELSPRAACQDIQLLSEIYLKHPRLFTTDEHRALAAKVRECQSPKMAGPQAAASDWGSGR